MIILKPTNGLINSTGIDYDLVTFILGRFVRLVKKATIRVERSKKNYSYYDDGCRSIFIDIKNECSLKYIISTILHEVRHFMQLRQKNNNLDYVYSSYNNYYSSPEEKDARKYEKVATEVCRIYNQHKKIEEKFKKYNLDSFKELLYTKEVNSNCLQSKINKQQISKEEE
jgi:hypothetical protein